MATKRTTGEAATPDVSRGLAGPEKRKDAEQSRTAIESFIGDFGLDIVRDHLTPDDLFLFAAAQKLDPWIDKLKIPTATRVEPTGTKEKIEEEVEKVVERTEYTAGEQQSPIPADTMDVTTLDRPEDLPDVLPSEWSAEEVAPELFYRRMHQRELLRRQWREETKEPVTTEDVVKEKIIREKEAPPEEIKRYAYVLLDVSGSMNDRDGRGIAARAFSLAFLRRGYLQRSKLGIRPFAAGVHQLSQGKTQEELKAIAVRITRLENAGGTNIHAALAHAIGDMRQGGAFDRADILLITDGYSYLGQNPLGDVRMHTVILGDPSVGLEGRGRQEVRQALKALKDWSTTFLHIEDTKELYRDLEITNEEVLEVEKESRHIKQEIAKRKDPEDIEVVRARAASLQQLVDFYINQLKEQTRALEDSFSPRKRLRAAQGVARLQKLQKVKQFLQKLLGDHGEELVREAREQGAREEADRAEQASEERALREAELQARAARGRAEADAEFERIREELKQMKVEEGEGEGDVGRGGDEQASGLPSRGTGDAMGSGGGGRSQRGSSPQTRPTQPERAIEQAWLIDRLIRWWQQRRRRKKL
ncbi:MAG: vWA domain-containing protein [bacterium]|nr:vWA domain-containing protein [bacterium]